MNTPLFQRLRTRAVVWLARRLPDCKEITPVIGESLDRMLSLREKIDMKLHLLTCRACRNYLSNLKFMKQAYQQKEQFENAIQPHASLSADARDRIKKGLEQSR